MSFSHLRVHHQKESNYSLQKVNNKMNAKSSVLLSVKQNMTQI